MTALWRWLVQTARQIRFGWEHAKLHKDGWDRDLDKRSRDIILDRHLEKFDK